MKSLEVWAGILLMAIICHSSNAGIGKPQPSNLAGNLKENLRAFDEDCYFEDLKRKAKDMQEVSMDNPTAESCKQECNAVSPNYCIAWSFSNTELHCFHLQIKDYTVKTNKRNGPNFQNPDCLTGFLNKFSNIGSTGSGRMREVANGGFSQDPVKISDEKCSDACKDDSYCYRWTKFRKLKIIDGKLSPSTETICKLYKLERDDDREFVSGVRGSFI